MRKLLLLPLLLICISWGAKKPVVSEPQVSKCVKNWDYEKEFNELYDETKYPNLKKVKADKKYWHAVFKSLSKAESCWNLTTRYVEPASLGKDAVTGVQNTSEGLFQMSYQDSKYHGCKFDWSKDKSKAVKDATKTIFEPKAQIECALIVMNKQLKDKPLYTNYYWSVLKPSNNRHKEFLAELKANGY